MKNYVAFAVVLLVSSFAHASDDGLSCPWGTGSFEDCPAVVKPVVVVKPVSPAPMVDTSVEDAIKEACAMGYSGAKEMYGC